MPKAILEFNLPEEREEYETTIQANAMHCVIWDMDNSVLRSALKYESFEDDTLKELYDKNPEHTLEVLQAVRTIFGNLVDRYDVKL